MSSQFCFYALSRQISGYRSGERVTSKMHLKNELCILIKHGEKRTGKDIFSFIWKARKAADEKNIFSFSVIGAEKELMSLSNNTGARQTGLYRFREEVCQVNMLVRNLSACCESLGSTTYQILFWLPHNLLMSQGPASSSAVSSILDITSLSRKQDAPGAARFSQGKGRNLRSCKILCRQRHQLK